MTYEEKIAIIPSKTLRDFLLSELNDYKLNDGVFATIAYNIPSSTPYDYPYNQDYLKRLSDETDNPELANDIRSFLGHENNFDFQRIQDHFPLKLHIIPNDIRRGDIVRNVLNGEIGVIQCESLFFNAEYIPHADDFTDDRVKMLCFEDGKYIGDDDYYPAVIERLTDQEIDDLENSYEVRKISNVLKGDAYLSELLSYYFLRLNGEDDCYEVMAPNTKQKNSIINRIKRFWKQVIRNME